MKRTEKFWDFLAKNYDRGGDDPSGRQDLDIIEKYLASGDTLLELACGTGTLSIAIAGQVKEIHAIDISSKMIALAQSKAAGHHIENIHFVHTTLYDDRYKPESFDVVMAFNILHLLEDLQPALQRINELLKSGAIFISTTPCLDGKMIFANRLLMPLLRLSSKTGLIPHVNFFNTPELEGFIANANFQILETRDFYNGNTDHFVVARKIDLESSPARNL
jgi:2-polyprenyl-3-methyl-5-hydroxy-6-metoxy-1,4-benzoquinol methylase